MDNRLKFLFILFIITLPSLVLGECTCDVEEWGDRDRNKTLTYKIAAIVSILVGGAIGVCIPIIGKTIPGLGPEKNIFFIIKAFVAGVILATGFIHVLPDAFESLTSPCLDENPWGNFPFTGFVAMVSAIGTLMVETFATSYYTRSHLKKAQLPLVPDDEKVEGLVHAHTNATHGLSEEMGSIEFIRYRVISQVLELGIVVHSRIIGISLGTSENLKDIIMPLVTALTFHQFFEGIALGSCIVQAKCKRRAVAIMGLFFSLTTPLGIVIGIGISNIYDETSPTALIVEGISNAASAGVLIYMALVDLLAADFMNPRMQHNRRLQAGANISLLLGIGFTSLLSKWV